MIVQKLSYSFIFNGGGVGENGIISDRYFQYNWCFYISPLTYLYCTGYVEDSCSTYEACYLASIDLGSGLWGSSLWYKGSVNIFEMIKQTNINKCICAPTHMHNLLHLWWTLFYSKYFSLWVSPCLWKCAWPVFLHAAGNFHWTVEDVAKSIVCMMMSGPCLTGYTQVLSLSLSLWSINLYFFILSDSF